MRRFTFGSGTVASILAGALLVASGCSGDGQVSFDPVGGSEGIGASGGDGSSGGSKMTGSGSTQNTAGSGNSGGNQANGGSANQAGTDSGGTDSGGTDSGGTDSGGTDSGGTSNNGGTDSGGTDTGGTTSTGGKSGSSNGGTSAGMAGKGGGPSCTPTPEICDGLDNNCDKVADPEGTCPAGCTGALFGGHTYYFCGVVASGEAALTKCTGLSMGVVSIESKEENDFVFKNIKGSSWLGGTDDADENHWLWVSTGTAFWAHGKVDGQYSNWAEDQPNNANDNGADESCLIIQAGAASKGTWNDLACSFDSFRATCESTDLVIGPIPL